MEKVINDEINPRHYTVKNPQPIEVIENWNLDFCLGNTVKYISRAGHKVGTLEGQITDLEKAQWYLTRRINQLRKTLHNVNNGEDTSKVYVMTVGDKDGGKRWEVTTHVEDVIPQKVVKKVVKRKGS